MSGPWGGGWSPCELCWGGGGGLISGPGGEGEVLQVVLWWCGGAHDYSYGYGGSLMSGPARVQERQGLCPVTRKLALRHWLLQRGQSSESEGGLVTFGRAAAF